jgi:hypothetical protein
MRKRKSERRESGGAPGGQGSAGGVVILAGQLPAGVRYGSGPLGGEPGKAYTVGGSGLPEGMTFGAVAAATFTLGPGA